VTTLYFFFEKSNDNYIKSNDSYIRHYYGNSQKRKMSIGKNEKTTGSPTPKRKQLSFLEPLQKYISWLKHETDRG